VKRREGYGLRRDRSGQEGAIGFGEGCPQALTLEQVGEAGERFDAKFFAGVHGFRGTCGKKSLPPFRPLISINEIEHDRGSEEGLERVTPSCDAGLRSSSGTVRGRSGTVRPTRVTAER
jgi:hypothetical protein